MNYVVEPMKEEDRPQVRALMEDCFPRAYHSIFFIKPEHTLVARAEGSIVGGMNMDVFLLPNGKKIGYLGWLYTARECRGKGIAIALTNEAIAHLEALRCDDILACVEGDNGSSMKVLGAAGFTIMPLRRQIASFGTGLAKINKRASRFFDMGYFLWHFAKGDEETECDATRSFLTMASMNILAWIPCLTGWNLLHILCPSLASGCRGDWLYLKSPIVLFCIPLFALAVRALVMEFSARVQHVDVRYLGWDTAWLLGFALPLLTGLPFPVPGNVYINGCHWRNSDMDGVLCRMARTAQLFLAFLCVPLRGSIAARYCFTLLLLDCLFFFYPFSGFNANRVRKRGTDAFVTPFVTTIVVAILLFL